MDVGGEDGVDVRDGGTVVLLMLLLLLLMLMLLALSLLPQLETVTERNDEGRLVPWVDRVTNSVELDREEGAVDVDGRIVHCPDMPEDVEAVL